MPTTTITELEELRRTKDWTYQELADAIAEKTQRKRDADCWRRICLGLTERPQARTLDILDEFLAPDKPKARPVRRRKVA